MLNQDKAMSLPIDIKKSHAPFRRTCHFATSWKDAVIIWGGHSHTEFIEERTSVLYLHVSGKWIKKETSGDILMSEHCVSVHILDNKMYVLVQGGHCINGPCRDCNTLPMYCLDLNSWTWSRLMPSGIPPLSGSVFITSWIYKENIYFFGGETLEELQGCHEYPSYLEVKSGTSNQLFCYNISKNSWEWPNLAGDIPSPRDSCLTTISENTVFLFGGETYRENKHYNDLYFLDMKSFVWKKVHDNITSGVTPRLDEGSEVLTRISKSTAVLTGSKHGVMPILVEEPAFHCWLLNLNKAKELSDPTAIWTSLYLDLKYRPGYAAVLEPVSQRLWLVGGHDIYSTNNSSAVIKMYLNPAPLRVLAMECSTNHVSSDDPKLRPGQLPLELRREILWSKVWNK